MIVEITVPELGESINEVEIGEWLVEVGEEVQADQELVTIESEKATVELPSPAAGTLVKIIKSQGEVASIGEVIGHIDTKQSGKKQKNELKPKPAEPNLVGKEETEAEKLGIEEPKQSTTRIMPAAARVLAEHHIEADMGTPTGPGGRLLKEDALKTAEAFAADNKKEQDPEQRPQVSRKPGDGASEPKEHRVHMTPIRRTIATRLLEARQTMALLTTFNEVDMSEIKRIRKEIGEEFADKHGVRLGYMSFFVRAVVAGLLDFPVVNAAIDGSDIVYHVHCDIGVAIGGGKGLVVPVLRGAERLSFAEIERKISNFSDKASNNSLTIEELAGGTFTISNGGIYGSMASTPIVNPPQSAILGLHAIKERPIAIGGEIKIRPIMYLALTYDHRIIDGREAVTFLKGIKERIENPYKLLLEI